MKPVLPHSANLQFSILEFLTPAKGLILTTTTTTTSTHTHSVSPPPYFGFSDAKLYILKFHNSEQVTVLAEMSLITVGICPLRLLSEYLYFLLQIRLYCSVMYSLCNDVSTCVNHYIKVYHILWYVYFTIYITIAGPLGCSQSFSVINNSETKFSFTPLGVHVGLFY